MAQIINITQHIEFDDGSVHHVQLFPAQSVGTSDPGPGPGPDGGGGTGPDMSVLEPMVHQALEVGGAYAVVGNDDAFRSNVLFAMGNYQDAANNGPDVGDLRIILDQAMLDYGGGSFPPLDQVIVDAVWASLEAQGFSALVAG